MAKLLLEDIIDTTPVELEIGDDKFTFKKLSVGQQIKFAKLSDTNGGVSTEDAETFIGLIKEVLT